MYHVHDINLSGIIKFNYMKVNYVNPLQLHYPLKVFYTNYSASID